MGLTADAKISFIILTLKPNTLCNFFFFFLRWRLELKFELNPFFSLSGFRMLGEIGLKNTEFLSDIVPVLIEVLNDDTPAVVRQALLCGIELFRGTLEKIVVQVRALF